MGDLSRLAGRALAGLNNGSNSGYNADEEHLVSDGIKTAFHGAQEARGATFVEEGGWYWSVSFGDLDAEYSAVRDGVGMWDVSPLNKWDFRGPDAVEAAQRVHSNDILGLRPGRSATARSSTRTGCWSTTGRSSSTPTITCGS